MQRRRSDKDAFSTEILMDYQKIMQANLGWVFNERDPEPRLQAIQRIYREDAVLYEPNSSAQGHEAICEAVTQLLDQLPPEFFFSALRPALGHNGVGRLQWRAGPLGGPAFVTGLDIAHIEEDKISSLHVFLDPPES
jgi:hypothetical protein